MSRYSPYLNKSGFVTCPTLTLVSPGGCRGVQLDTWRHCIQPPEPGACLLRKPECVGRFPWLAERAGLEGAPGPGDGLLPAGAPSARSCVKVSFTLMTKQPGTPRQTLQAARSAAQGGTRAAGPDVARGTLRGRRPCPRAGRAFPRCAKGPRVPAARARCPGLFYTGTAVVLGKILE